jgi:hypothetical protein
MGRMALDSNRPILWAVLGGTGIAVGGALKDAPFEGFRPLTFLRSPIVAAALGLLVIRQTSDSYTVMLASMGGERIAVEAWKTFIVFKHPSKFPTGVHPGRAPVSCLSGIPFALTAMPTLYDLLGGSGTGTIGLALTLSLLFTIPGLLRFSSLRSRSLTPSPWRDRSYEAGRRYLMWGVRLHIERRRGAASVGWVARSIRALRNPT